MEKLHPIGKGGKGISVGQHYFIYLGEGGLVYALLFNIKNRRSNRRTSLRLRTSIYLLLTKE
jgi:hypothetical protein